MLPMLSRRKMNRQLEKIVLSERDMRAGMAPHYVLLVGPASLIHPCQSYLWPCELCESNEDLL